MFAIAFDLVVADTAQHHPKGVSQAYTDIGGTLSNFGFNRVQGSLYTTPSELGQPVRCHHGTLGIAVVARVRAPRRAPWRNARPPYPSGVPSWNRRSALLRPTRMTRSSSRRSRRRG